MARKIEYIVVHCSATKPGQNIGVDAIREWHVNGNGWADVGYHWVIRRDGTIEDGRPEDKVGAHVYGFNRNSLGICMVGGIKGPDGVPTANFTRAQWGALDGLVQELKWKYKDAEVLGHRDFPGVDKDCPCFDVRDWWNENTENRVDFGQKVGTD